MPRPTRFPDFHGQKQAVAQLKVPVISALKTGKPLGHVLLSGPKGLGKTTLALILATEMGAPLVQLNAAAIEQPQQLLNPLTMLKKGSVLFLDEIHALPRALHEHLYTAMEDGKITLIVGDAKNAQPITVDLEPFTLIGATTREGLLSAPLLDRFKSLVKLDLYSEPEMIQVLRWVSNANGTSITDGALDALGPACHGTARHAVTLLDACVDTIVAGDLGSEITSDVVSTTLSRLGYVNGLNRNELALLRKLAKAGRPVGVSTMAAVLDEEVSTIETVYEPWLLRVGLIEKTPTGRIITNLGLSMLCQ